MLLKANACDSHTRNTRGSNGGHIAMFATTTLFVSSKPQHKLGPDNMRNKIMHFHFAVHYQKITIQLQKILTKT